MNAVKLPPRNDRGYNQKRYNLQLIKSIYQIQSQNPNSEKTKEVITKKNVAHQGCCISKSTKMMP